MGPKENTEREPSRDRKRRRAAVEVVSVSASSRRAPPRLASGVGLPGLQIRGRAPPRSYVGLILRRPPGPSGEDREAPRPARTEHSGSSPHLHFMSDPARAEEEGIWVEALGLGTLASRGDLGTHQGGAK